MTTLERKCLEMELRLVLELFRYSGRQRHGFRTLRPFHIDALMADLLPFIERKISEVREAR